MLTNLTFNADDTPFIKKLRSKIYQSPEWKSLNSYEQFYVFSPPERLVWMQDGIYRAVHWNIRDVIDGICDVTQLSSPLHPFRRESCIPYGTCDSIEYFVNNLCSTLHNSQNNYFVSFVKIDKHLQPKNGGWRWSAWGPYYGNQKIESEYLSEERHIESVCTFQIFQLR
jgi:hypothetical protein